MDFVTFDGFDFNFEMLPHVKFTLYKPVSEVDDAGMINLDSYDDGTKVSEPLVSSNYNNITYDSNTGGSLRTEINGWWSHIPDVPKGSKLVCDDGRVYKTTNSGRTDIVPASFYYAIKEVDNDDRATQERSSDNSQSPDGSTERQSIIDESGN